MIYFLMMYKVWNLLKQKFAIKIHFSFCIKNCMDGTVDSI